MPHPNQEFEAVRDQCEAFRFALRRIVGLAPEEKVIPLDRAFATVREMRNVAMDALKEQAR